MPSLIGAPINRQAAGLLSALDIKSMGSTPRELANFVQSVIDLGPLYLSDKIEVAEFSLTGGITSGSQWVRMDTATNNVGSWDFGPLGTALRVPEGEIWYVREWHSVIFWNAVAGDSGFHGPAVRVNSPTGVTGGQIHVLPVRPSFFQSSIAARSTRGYAHTDETWLLPGWYVGAYADVTVAGATGVNIAMQVARLRY